MRKKDKIKVIVIAILLVIIIVGYLLYGKDATEMKYISGFCLITWVATMFIVNKKFK